MNCVQWDVHSCVFTVPLLCGSLKMQGHSEDKRITTWLSAVILDPNTQAWTLVSVTGSNTWNISIRASLLCSLLRGQQRSVAIVTFYPSGRSSQGEWDLLWALTMLCFCPLKQKEGDSEREIWRGICAHWFLLPRDLNWECGCWYKVCSNGKRVLLEMLLMKCRSHRRGWSQESDAVRKTDFLFEPALDPFLYILDATNHLYNML